MSETCQSCRFWAQQPADPMNLGATRPGLCRGGPPSLVVLPNNTLHGPGLLIQPMFPTLGPDEPACGTYRPRQADGEPTQRPATA
jgi:hypothetical protein